MIRTQNTLLALIVLAGVTSGLAGCQSVPASPSVVNAWAKATDTPMTGVFAEITNPGPEPVSVIGGSSEAGTMVELHEVADGIMREKEGGFVIEPGQTYTLEPGADHIMLMGLTDELRAGDTVGVVLELDNGDSLEFRAEIRDFAGANEEYDPGHGGMGHD